MPESAASVHAGEDTLELYAMEKLRGPKLARLEEHLLLCERCRASLAEIDESVSAFRLAAEESISALAFTHQTTDGPVRLLAAREGREWSARFDGPLLEGTARFGSLFGAWRFLQQSFAEMFPEHRCGKRCRQGVEKKTCRPRGAHG